MPTSDDDFDPESRSDRNIAGEAAQERSDFLTLVGNAYRGELDRTSLWRTRIDRTTNWAVVLTATLLTWAFSTESRPHYVLLVGLVMLSVFLGIEARRYRTYDIWRSRVRLLEENVFANALDRDGVTKSDWRELLGDDLRHPTIKVPAMEAVSRRLRRVYAPLISVLVGAWVVRITVFTGSGRSVVDTAAIGAIPGAAVLVVVALFYTVAVGIAFWPRHRTAKGELQTTDDTEEWK